MRSWLLLGIAVGVMLVPAVGASAQPVGTVQADDRSPVVGALVVLRNGIDTWRTTTSPTGSFQFGAVAPGRYELHVRAVGFRSHSTVVDLRRDGPEQQNVIMRRLEDAASDEDLGSTHFSNLNAGLGLAWTRIGSFNIPKLTGYVKFNTSRIGGAVFSANVYRTPVTSTK